MRIKNIDTKIIFLYCLVFSAIVSFYTPVFGSNFAYLNDYMAFMPLYYGFPDTIGLFQLGRPIQAILVNIQFRFLGDMLSLQMMRIFIVLMIATAAILFFRYLIKNIKMNNFSAALLSMLTFTLPSMTINSFFIAQSIPGIVPLFFVLPAHSLMQKTNANSIGVNRNQIIFIAFMLIFLSLFIYTPITYFFLTLTFIKLFFGTKDQSKAKLKDIYTEVMVLLAASIAYFLFIKLIYNPIVKGQVIESGAHAFALSFDLFSKVPHLIDLIILDLSAWFPPLDWIFIAPLAVIYILICTRASLTSPYLSQLRNSSKIILGMTFSILIPILTAIPILVIQGDYPPLYRMLLPSMAVTMPIAIVFIIDRTLLAGKGSIAFVPVLAVVSVFIVLAEIASHHRLVIEVKRLSAEYQHVFDAVTRDNNNGELSKNQEGQKFIRIPPFNFTLLPEPELSNYLYRDFGYTAVNSSPEAMVRAAMQSIDATARMVSGNRSMDGFQVIYDPLGPRYRADISDGILFSLDGYPSFVSSFKGISGKEAWGRWTDSEEAVIEFTQPLPKSFTLRINAGASSSVIGKPIKLIVGDAQLEAIFNTEEPSEVVVPVSTNGLAKSIIFRFPKTKSPMEQGLSGDTRHLGLGLIKLLIESHD